MRIVCIGGGPGGLYFGLLMKKAHPRADISVFERNRADDTFGWGVVFSDETLGHFEDSDPQSYRAITEGFSGCGRSCSRTDPWCRTCQRLSGSIFANSSPTYPSYRSR